MKRGKNKNRMSSSLMVMKKNLKKKKMSSNSYNNRLSGSCSSSPILKRHKKMGVRTTMISDLPEEVLTKVLVRVSCVKDVLSCVCVKKSWFFLIKTRKFITLHSNHQISSRNNKYLLFWDHKAKSYEIRVDDIGCKKYLKPKYPPQLSKLYFRCRLVSNGLICLFTLRVTTNPLDIYLWNPVIQKYISLPHSPHPPTKTWEKAIAFGFVPQTNDYLVVYMIKYTPHSIFITCVYSLNTNSWTKITHPKTHNIQNICQSGGIFVNGIAIWTAYNLHNHRILVCFDTKTHMLREILSPKTPGKLGGSHPLICAFDDDDDQSVVYFVEKGAFLNEHDMWILKGDPMTEFVWEKKMMIRPKKAFARVLGLRNNGDPILRNAFNLISYDLDTHNSYHFASSWNNWTTFHFGDNRHPRAAFFFWKERVTPKPFMIRPFAESLALLA